MYIDAEHVQQLIADGYAQVADVERSREFGEFLDNSMSWNAAGTGLSWAEVPHVRLDLSNESGGSVVQRAVATCVGNHEFVLVMFSPDQPALVCGLEFALNNLDTLYWGAPGNRYMCGVDIESNKIVPTFNDLGEFDGRQYLTCAVS